MIPVIGLVSCIYLFPESPRWLIDHNQPETGLTNLARLYSNGDIDDIYILTEYEIIKQQIQEKHLYTAKTYSELFRIRGNIRRIILIYIYQISI